MSCQLMDSFSIRRSEIYADRMKGLPDLTIQPSIYEQDRPSNSLPPGALLCQVNTRFLKCSFCRQKQLCCKGGGRLFCKPVPCSRAIRYDITMDEPTSRLAKPSLEKVSRSP